MKAFNVIIEDVNSKQFTSYNVIPYLKRCYEKEENKPVTFDEFKEFITRKSRYQWWARCEYEIILKSWPTERIEKKIDVHQQVMMNIDIIVEILIEEVTK